MRVRQLSGPLFLLGLLALWEAAARMDLTNPLLVPAVSRILSVFWEAVLSGQIPAQIAVSMKRAAAGYLLAAAVFIPLGIVMGLSQRPFERSK